MLRKDYENRRKLELKRLENITGGTSDKGPYLRLKISSAEGRISSFEFLSTASISEVMTRYHQSSALGQNFTGRGLLYLDGEPLDPESRVCDHGIEEGDILELH